MELNMEALESLTSDSIDEILESWNYFCSFTNSLSNFSSSSSTLPVEFISHLHILCNYGLRSLLLDHFLQSLEVAFETTGASRFWQYFDSFVDGSICMNEESRLEEILFEALAEISLVKQHQERSLLMLVHNLQSQRDSMSHSKDNSSTDRSYLLSKYQLMVTSVLMASLPRQFPAILHQYFKKSLEDLSTLMDGGCEEECYDKENMDLDGKCKLPSEVGEMDIDEHYNQKKFSENSLIVKNIGTVVQNLRSLGFTSMTEDAYASAIFLLLKDKVQDLAGDDYRSSVLDPIKIWIQEFNFVFLLLLSFECIGLPGAFYHVLNVCDREIYSALCWKSSVQLNSQSLKTIISDHTLKLSAVPFQFLHALLTYLGDSVCPDSPSSGLKSPLASQPSSLYPGLDTPSESLIRWKLRLEYFAYETLQDLRIAKLFDIIVDYPDSSSAIEDLKQCLDYTGQHSKLVDSFISALKYRLLTAGASTNDILHQYVSTIKALRTIDPAGIFLEAVGEPIREYLRGRKDTIKCIVTMLTDGSGGNASSGSAGDSLLEELNRDEENQENIDLDDDFNVDDKQAWVSAQRWEPDPVEADPLKGSRNRRKVNVLGMIVGIIGSKDQLVNEYRVMLAEKLLNKSDYDIDSEIRTLELLKIHFGESSMQKCEIMLNDLIDSKRTNTNIKKAIVPKSSQAGGEVRNTEFSLDAVDATIISSNFWPPIQDEPVNLPGAVEELLSDYAKRFHEIKTPRKLLWKKNLGVVKLELQFEDKAIQFSVSPLLASIIMQFQDQTCWTSKELATAVGVPIDILNRRIGFWISKGVLAESVGGDTNDRIFSLVEGADSSRTSIHGGNDELLMADEDGDRSVASVEDQLLKEMTIYEKFIMGMLTNFGSMALDRIHNTLKMFCVADPAYDKSLQQLQSFLAGLVSEEKLELRDGMYILKK